MTATATASPAQFPLARLVEDLSIYPRHDIDSSNVRRLVLAIQAGKKLPPIIVEEGKLRIIDGFHRYRAWLHVLGPEGEVEVGLVHYNSPAEALADAIARNSSHGLPLTPLDQARCLMLAEEAGLSFAEACAALGLPEPRGLVLKERRATTKEGLPEPLKFSVRHLQRIELTPTQVEALKSAPGVPYRLNARQLASGAAADLLPDEEQDVAAYREAVIALLRWLCDRIYPSLGDVIPVVEDAMSDEWPHPFAARRGRARLGRAGLGMARQARLGTAGLG
jgi:hypothetical protein